MQNNELEVVNVRLVKEPSLYSDKAITGPDDAIRLMATELSQYDREVFCILNLKADGNVINMNIASMGTLHNTLVSPREIFKSSILSNAASIIAVHNHPSGTITPSREDMATAKMIKECGELLGIKVLDHIIVGGENGKTVSFLKEGLMDTEPAKSRKCMDMER
ncbi:JAB domain-containing protein [Anaerovorax odorimutans]|uniref:JAB domain-containing protein n=1 Tax=Anaerovorax odorimutans TaxID=109327 RepID=A0ABT1RTV9_9FIRM|nr:JAB domain-containing protein [Anaerovorax odorimutans]MCQ4638647.1 JAB domain-containing protein [Anaerovorax odorimutans]